MEMLLISAQLRDADQVGDGQKAEKRRRQPRKLGKARAGGKSGAQMEKVMLALCNTKGLFVISVSYGVYTCHCVYCCYMQY